MLKRFFSYYHPYRGMFFLDMLASLLISLIGLFYPVITRNMLNDYIPNKAIQLIVLWGGILLGLYVVRMLLRYFVQYYGHVIGIKMQGDMRRELFSHLETLPYSYFDNHETGKLMSRLTNDLMEVSELAHHGPENVFICGITIVLSFIYLALINGFLTLIIFACVPFLVVITFFAKKQMSDAFMESRKSIAVINSSIESSISGIRVTKAFTNQEKEIEKFEESNQGYINSKKKAYKAMGRFFSQTNFITDFFNVVVLIAGGFFLYQGQIDFADYSAFIVSVNLFIAPLTTLINFTEQYQNGVTGFKRFTEIMDVRSEKEIEDAFPLEEVMGKIEFKDVSFNYDSEKGLLNHLNLNIKQGEKIALVGPSGGGKTTICHLIPRFYDISSGTILIDDRDIGQVTLESLRRNIGIVQQDVFLFNGTIKENILYGKLNASMEEVVEASKKANIYDFVQELPKGFDTEIGERGVRLSGGQKQRLSIARVFLKNPRILILDEATSALDNTTEILIQSSLDELMKGRTCICVAHRLSTIKTSNEIVVVNQGKIEEQGTHEELMERNGIYSNLYSLQFRNE